VARIRQRVSAGVAQHVGMHHEGESGALADTLDQAIDGVRGERAVPLPAATASTSPRATSTL
jgi:hypothetical protein